MNQETIAASVLTDAQKNTRKSIGDRSDEDNGFGYKEELVGNNPEERNWKGVAIAILVIMGVIGLIVLSVVLLTPETNVPVIPKITMNDVISEEWKSGLSDGTWQGSNLVHRDMDGNVVSLTSLHETPETLIPKNIMKDNGIVGYKISSDGRYALLIFDKVPIYTYSNNASYYIYNIKTGKKKLLIHEKTESVFQFAEFGPNGSQIIYSLDGDLYYKPSVKSTTTTRLTSTGSLGSYHNGITDWLYEEEVMKATSALWWSASGSYLAFASFDDRHVEDSYVTAYSDQEVSNVLTYKKPIEYKYPKVGYRNPIVNVHILNLETGEEVVTIKPTLHRERLDIFHSLTWLGDDELLITWSDRTMTSSVMQQCFPTIATCMDDVLHQTIGKGVANTNSEPGWLVNLNQPVLPSDDANIFFYILPSDHGGMGDFNHLALVNKTAKPSTKRFLTEGNWEVTKLLHYDAVNQEVYYVSNEPHPGSRHVYRVKTDSSGGRKCVTCSLNRISVNNAEPLNQPSGGKKPTTENENTICSSKKKCLYYEASFGKRSDICMVKCLGPCIPYSGVVLIQRGISDFAIPDNAFDRYSIQVIDNPSLSPSQVVVPRVRYDTLWSGNTRIRIKVLVPASIHVGKRPVVFFKDDVGTQTVDFRFKVDLASYIVTSIGAVAVFVDGRGSGFDGNRLLQAVAGEPGHLEIEDMRAVLESLESQENIDTENVGVVGVSGYGGYTAALALTDRRFRCGVARSPISDWRLYDTIGAEHLLGSPGKNPLLYQKSNLIQHIGGMQDGQLRIYHGLQDRKVNMQQSVLLEQAAMLSNLPLDAVQVTYHPTVDQIRDTNEGKKVETYVCESVGLFLRNCLFGNSEQGKIKLELLKENYGIKT